MKFTCTVHIHKPQQVVADFFVKPEYLKEYQEGFQKKELISGNAWEVNAVSKLYYQSGKRKMELTETVLKNDLPGEFLAAYYHTHTENTMKSTFTVVSANETRYDAEIHYTKFKGIIIKVTAFLFPFFLKKQVQKWLVNFKHFVERQ
ncbi:MAG: hypothetical protein GKR88_04840 [Flavobacteriaceae bacterium]|nr:MAG: hypothetical protein GKR88_04840 [Flavobacteriaceae bacterium]